MSTHTGVQKHKKKKNEQIEDAKWKDKYLRAMADYQNLENRVAHRSAIIEKRANERLIQNFLEVLDDIEKASLFIKDEGLALVSDKFIKILADEGVRELDVLHKEFDPYIAECVALEEGERDNIVVNVARKGYTLHDVVIRPARVTVSQKK